MNFLAGLALASDAGALWLESEGRRLCRVAPDDDVARLDLAGAVLGVRPEHVVVDPDPARGVAATVIDVVPEGREIVVGLSLAGGTELVSIVPATLELGLDQAVSVGIDEAYLHFFDGATGAALHHGRHGEVRA